MALSRDDAERILADKTRAKMRTGRRFTDDERKRRERAQVASWREAAAAVARLHPDEFRALYEVALERRLKEAGF